MTRVPNSAATFAARAGIGVDDSDELRAGEFAPDAHVIAAELADADDRHANGFLAHDFFFASDLRGADGAAFGRKRLNGDAGLIGGADQRVAFEEQRAAAHRSPAPWRSSGASLRWF